MTDLEFHEVDQTRWQDFERLFEAKGGPKSCWCMVWRAGAQSAKGPDRKTAIKSFVCGNIPIGILGYKNGVPIAWCSIAPKPTHRDLGWPNDATENPNDIWSLTCFYIARQFRGENLSKQILNAAVQHAKANGAKIVEAYPVDPSSPSYRFMGFTKTFSAAGFHEIGRAGTRRHVMRLDLLAA